MFELHGLFTHKKIVPPNVVSFNKTAGLLISQVRYDISPTVNLISKEVVAQTNISPVTAELAGFSENRSQLHINYNVHYSNLSKALLV